MSKSLFSASFLTALVVLVLSSALTSYAAPASCESLASMKLPDTTVTGATMVPAGPFTPPAPAESGARPRPIQVPAFCRVQLTVAPAVKIEVWMPASGWNGNFNGVGGGGFAGVIAYPALATALQAGYATASTDTGHEGNSADFALGHPELVVDFGYRGIHEMTLKGKDIVKAYYGTAPRIAYFTGCSQGGKQGLTEAQRYPEDYDGILAGAPGINYVHLEISHMWVALATLKDEASYIPPAKLGAIQDASVAACDTLDGLKDGLVDDPRKCHFDPTVLLCKGEDNASCLSDKQVEALKKLYSDVKYPGSEKVIYPGHFPGVEKGWNNFVTGSAIYKSTHYTYGISYMRNLVFKDRDWDFRSWDWEKDVPLVDGDQKMHEVLDSMNPDLRPFREHGGKLIVYQGWGDDDVAPLNTIGYYKSVVAAVSGGKDKEKDKDAYREESASFDRAAEQAGSFMRLFMIPGMNHCGGGSGPNTFNGIDALSTWVEKKQPPEQIVASHLTNNAVDRTRPLCPYPMTAQYSGQGSIDEAANFSCKMPKPN